MNDFSTVPIESDTRINREQEVQVAKLQALHQEWSWDGMAAESIIFHANDVKHFSNEKLFKKVKEYCSQKDSSLHNESYTMKRESSGFTFVNFNFLTADDFL